MKYLNRNTKNILLATDFSQTAQRAFDAAVRLARTFGAKLHVLHVNEEDAIFEGHSSEEVTHFINDIARRRAEWMKRFETGSRDAGVDAISLLRGGVPADTILQEAETCDAGVIVIGSQGAHGLGNLLHGSVARKVLRRSTRPVMVVSKMAGVAPCETTGTFENILYPTDLSEASKAGLEVVETVLKRTEAKLTLVNILRMPRIIPSLPGEPFLTVPTKAVDHLTEKIEAQMKTLTEHLGPDRVESAIGVHTDPAEGIAEMSAHGGVDLIMMPKHSTHGMGAYFFGSTAERLVKLAPVPVLLFSPMSEE